MRSSPEVEQWLSASEHPKKDVMQAVRKAVLEADARVTETIKWKSPTFMFNGNIASINPQARSHVSLMFHTGASIPGDFPSLQGGGGTARYMRFEDEADCVAKASELQAIVRAWCEMKAKPSRQRP
jgi:hypothetical protein